MSGNPAISPWLTSPGQAAVDWFVTDNSGQPILLRMKSIGDNGVVLAAAVMTAVGAAQGFVNDGVPGKVANFFTGGVLGGALNPWFQYIIFICKMAMGAFLLLSLWLPLIPFFVYTGQVLNWLISVIEGVAAAPFLAFAHFDTSGNEGLGQRTNYGYTFMLQAFMRPVMLVFAFVVASKVLDAFGTFYMKAFPTAIANVQMTSMTGFFSILGFIIIFFVFAIGIVNSAMSITYILPDAIWAFMGASSSATAQIGRNMSDETRRAAGGMAAPNMFGQGRQPKQGNPNQPVVDAIGGLGNRIEGALRNNANNGQNTAP